MATRPTRLSLTALTTLYYSLFDKVSTILSSIGAMSTSLSSITQMRGLLYGYVGKGTALISNTAAERSVLPSPGSGSLTLPGDMIRSGTAIVVRGRGRYSARLVTPGTLTFRVKAGGATVGVVVLGNLIAGVSGGCDFAAVIAIGDGGMLQVSGEVGYIVSAVEKRPAAIAMVGTPAVVLDQPLAIDITAQWSIGDTANFLTATYASVLIERAGTA